MGASDLLVVGAGPVGMLLAAELKRHGSAVRVIDKTTGPCSESRAFAIQPRTLEVLFDLGLADAFIERGHISHGMILYAQRRRVMIGLFDLVDSPYPFVLNIAQRDCEAILLGHLRELGVEVERSTELVGLTQREGDVQATVRQGSTEKIETAGWIVGCDGSHSTVREQLGLTLAGHDYPEAWVLAEVEMDWPLGDDVDHKFMTADGKPLHVAALPAGKFRVDAVCAPEASGPATVEEMQGYLDLRGPLGARVRSIGWNGRYRIHARSSSHYRTGRVFLAGDAVHINSPIGGQGLNTGVQDAYNLGMKLALAIRGRVSEAVLDSYELERRAVALGVLQLTGEMEQMTHLHSHIGQEFRDHLMPLISSQPLVQEHMARQIAELAIDYRKSPIVVHQDEGRFGHHRFGPGPRPGQLAMDAGPLMLEGVQTSLHGLLRGPRHLAMVYAGPSGRRPVEELDAIASGIRSHNEDWLRTLIVTPGEPLDGLATQVVSDPRLAAHHRYGAESDCLYVIRPDGYVGTRSQPASVEGFERYVRALGVKSASAAIP
jgi:2-polyprenyl-6-methoxyphenol hydroxylase-like FAD-dependent oxidoreductase